MGKQKSFKGALWRADERSRRASRGLVSIFSLVQGGYWLFVVKMHAETAGSDRHREIRGRRFETREFLK